MKFHKLSSERGATLVYVALIMVVLLAFVALAVDVGHLYAERRHMQNAADAGALAGAYELCFGTASAWETTAESYATTNNRAQAAVATLENNWTVNVVASETANTYLAGIIGINNVPIAAEAAAACGQADSACGLWPIAFDLNQWTNDLLTRPCGEVFYVWSDDHKDTVDCVTEYICDIDGNGTDDVITGTGRAWLDFSSAVTEEYPDGCTQSGCGAAELKCQLASDSGALLTLPVCINGDTGVKAGVKNAVDSRIGDDVNVPLFNGPCAAGGDCSDAFNAVAFGCITIVGWEQQLELLRQDGSNPSYKAKVVKAAVSCDPASCASYCGGTTGAPPVPKTKGL